MAILHEDGIYFGMPEAEYLADPALGSSDLKTLARSAADYWWFSPMNPDRPADKDTDGKAFGSALHKALLEGVSAYAASYYVPEERPEACVQTVEQMKAVLEGAGIKYKSSFKRADFIAIIREKAPDVLIYDDWFAAMTAEAGDRTPIKPEWDRAIRLMSAIIVRHPQLQNAFVGGAPEVSVFWTVDGVRFRARFDYLKPHGVFDLKSISNWRARLFRDACVQDMRYYGYGYQAAHYMDARAQLVRLIKEGRVFGDVNAGFLAEIEKAGDAYEFVFVFMQTIGSPRALPIRFPQGTTVHGKFQQEIEQSVAVYRDYRERFGDGMWVEVDELWRPSDEELAALMWS